MRPREDRIALREALWRQNVGLLTVRIFHQCDECGSVGIVFDAFDGCRNVALLPLEVDNAVGLLVTAAAKAHGDAPIVVAPAARILAVRQGPHRLATVQARTIDDHELASAWRDRVIGLECHRAALPYRPVVTSIV